MLFKKNAQNAQSVTAQRKRILIACRHLTDTEKTRQGFKLISQGNSEAHRRRGQRIARKTRLVVLANRKRHFFAFAIVQRIVFAHDALQLREFTHHQRQKVNLGKLGRAHSRVTVGTDQISHAGSNRFDAFHAFGLRAKLIVINHIL